jgi:hypothetical protein
LHGNHATPRKCGREGQARQGRPKTGDNDRRQGREQGERRGGQGERAGPKAKESVAGGRGGWSESMARGDAPGRFHVPVRGRPRFSSSAARGASGGSGGGAGLPRPLLLQFGQGFVVFASVRPLFRRDDVIKGGSVDGNGSDDEFRGTWLEVLVALAAPVTSRPVTEDVQVAGVGTPCRDLHGAQHRGVQLDR